MEDREFKNWYKTSQQKTLLLLHLLVCFLLRLPTSLTCSKHHQRHEKIKQNNKAPQTSELGKGGKTVLE